MTTIVSPSNTSATATPPTRKPSTPGQPWSHAETTALIDAYESKWYSLKRGQLKSHQWDEVSATVAERCNTGSSNSSFSLPSKSGTQCRHKIEKLRKRYRAEKTRPFPSLWPYFERMDRMERGPVPIAVQAPQFAMPIDSEGSEEEEEEEEEGQEEEDEDMGEEEERVKVRVLMEVANEVRRFGEGMVRVEKRRMEMMREVERDWMEMEAKRAGMVAEAQRSMVESIDGVFAAMRKKKARRGHES